MPSSIRKVRNKSCFRVSHKKGRKRVVTAKCTTKPKAQAQKRILDRRK